MQDRKNAPSRDDRENGQRWSAVEEATELLHEERFRDALDELRTVLASDPKNEYAYYFLGIAFFEIGEIEASRDAYAACVKLAPAHLGARVALCHVLRMLGDTRGALREGMTGLSQAPGDADALHAIGLVHHARGEQVPARKYLEAFLATGPELEVALETRALLATLDSDAASQDEADD